MSTRSYLKNALKARLLNNSSEKISIQSANFSANTRSLAIISKLSSSRHSFKCLKHLELRFHCLYRTSGAKHIVRCRRRHFSRGRCLSRSLDTGHGHELRFGPLHPASGVLLRKTREQQKLWLPSLKSQEEAILFRCCPSSAEGNTSRRLSA